MFDFAERSIRYLIGFWLVVGFLLSFLVQVSMLIWRVGSGTAEANREDALETSTAAVRKPTAAPTDSAVRY
jgi:hypothetical protein